MTPVTAEVSTRLRYPEFGPDPDGDELVFVGDVEVGCTYATAYDPDGTVRDGWASWGAAGWSGGHRSRAEAQQVQVDAYLADPQGYERRHAEYLADLAAQAAAREEEERAARQERAERQRIEREGTDAPGPVLVTVPAYYALYGPQPEVDAVSAWLTSNGIDDASGIHDITVEQRANRQAIVYQACQPWAAGRDAPTFTKAVTLTVPAPDIAMQPRPDLHGLLSEHWPVRLPLHDFGEGLYCGVCRDGSGRPVWPCQAVTDAIAGGGS